MSSAAVTGVNSTFDRHFRWRGTNVSRLEGFSDSVFAMVLGLLFLRAMPPETFTDLKAAMKALVPFALTFAIIGYVWVEHWLFSRRYDLQDRWAMLLQMLLLFLLLFYAYPLKYLFTLLFVALAGPIGATTNQMMRQGFDTEGDAVLLFVFYGVGYGTIFAMIALLYGRAAQCAESLGLNQVERFLTRSGAVQAWLQVGVAALSIAVAISGIGLRMGLPGWLYGGIGPLMCLHGVAEGRRLRRLQATTSPASQYVSAGR